MNREERVKAEWTVMGDSWNQVLSFLEKLFDERKSLDDEEIFKLYEIVYRNCTGEGYQRPGRYFYRALSHFLDRRLQIVARGLEKITDEGQLLSEYVEAWLPYRKASEEFNRCCGYFNRYWIKVEREQKETDQEVFEVYRLAVITWMRLVYRSVDQALVSGLNRLLLAQDVDMGPYYETLLCTAELFAMDPGHNVPVPEKLNNVFDPHVMAFFKNETLRKYETLLDTSAFFQLKHFLGVACLAFPEIETEPSCTKLLKNHIQHRLKEAFEKPTGARIVGAVADVRQGKLEWALRDHKPLRAVIDQVLEVVINTERNNCANRLALYCHELMTNSTLLEEAFKCELRRVVAAVEFLYDKDVFMGLCKKFLRKRQIEDTSVSDERESLMVSLLTGRFGHEATMSQVIQLREFERSKLLQTAFKKHLSNVELGFEFNIKIFWRYSDCESTLKLPPELQRAVREFEMFFKSANPRTNVQFDWASSIAHVRLNYKGTSFIVQVTTFQLALLLQFNLQEQFTVGQLMDNLCIDLSTIMPHLNRLIEKQILTRCGSGGGQIGTTDVVELNNDFSSKHRRLDVKPKNQIMNINSKEQEYLLKFRRAILEAAVVRVMKKHKTLPRIELKAFVIKEVSNHFHPNIDLINAAIEALVTKGYIGHSPGGCIVYVNS